MAVSTPIARTVLLLGLAALVPGCVIEPHGYYDEPREGYYDRGQHRWWHQHDWHECRDRDDQHCIDSG
jgi:hypothetical protein